MYSSRLALILINLAMPNLMPLIRSGVPFYLEV